MAGTYTTAWQTVTDGETTTETPRDLVVENNIAVSNAEIQWEGVDETETTTDYKTNVDTDSVAASIETRVNSDTAPTLQSDTTAPDSGDLDGGTSTSVTFSDPTDPAYPDPYEITGHEYELKIDTGGSSVTVTYDDIDGVEQTQTVSTSFQNVIYSETVDTANINGNYVDEIRSVSVSEPVNSLLVRVWTTYTYFGKDGKTATATFPTVESDETFDGHLVEEYKNGEIINTESISQNKTGESRSLTFDTGDDTWEIRLFTFYDQHQSVSVAYPPVPSGYSFNKHYYRKETSGEIVDSDFVFDNRVGETRTVTSQDASVVWDLRMETEGEDTNFNTKNTEDPSVSGDVSASYTETLTDGDTSPWQPLSGLSAGDNTFTHDIHDSQQARYRIRFDWEYAVPDELAVQRINANGTTYEVTLANPDDDALFYNTVQTYVTGIGYLAYDVVDPDNPDALPVAIHHPDHGTLRFRKR